MPDNGFNRALGLAFDLDGPTYQSLYNAGKRGGWRHPVKRSVKRNKVA
jgi:hypothetical protein